MDVVKAWALQMKTISFKILGAKMNIECIKYLQKNSVKTIFEKKNILQNFTNGNVAFILN